MSLSPLSVFDLRGLMIVILINDESDCKVTDVSLKAVSTKRLAQFGSAALKSDLYSALVTSASNWR